MIDQDFQAVITALLKQCPPPNDWDLLDGLDSANGEECQLRNIDLYENLKSHKHIIQLISNAILDASQWPTE